MKAMIYRQYGGPEVVTLADVAKPVPKQNEVLIGKSHPPIDYPAQKGCEHP